MAKNPFIALVATDPEKYISTNVFLAERISISISTVAEALGITKKEVINNVLHIGLTQYVNALRSERPDLSHDENGSLTCLTPSEARDAYNTDSEGVEQTDLVEESERKAS
jgi:hypothetical protein